MSLAGLLSFNDEWNRIDSETGGTQLEPVAHDSLYFSSNIQLGCVQVRLKFIEAVEIPLACHLVVTPGRVLDAWEHHACLVILWPPLRPHIPVAVFRVPIRTR